jgi:hypothetical protein
MSLLFTKLAPSYVLNDSTTHGSSRTATCEGRESTTCGGSGHEGWVVARVKPRRRGMELTVCTDSLPPPWHLELVCTPALPRPP